MSSGEPQRSLERVGYRALSESASQTLEELKQLLQPFGLTISTKIVQDETWFKILPMNNPIDLTDLDTPPLTSFGDTDNIIPIDGEFGHKHWVRIWGEGEDTIRYIDSADNSGRMPMPSGSYKGKIIICDASKESVVPVHIIFDGSWPLTASRQGGAQFDSYPDSWDVSETWGRDNASSKTVCVVAPTPLTYYFIPAAELD